MKRSVLFVCIHNSARSQVAEEMLRKHGGDRYETQSAGIEPGRLNPNVIEVLKEDDGIDISGKKTCSVADLIASGRTFDYVITVCDETSAERCPMFPGKHQRIHWGFPDPSRFTGSRDEILARVREVKATIEERILSWLKEQDLRG